MKTILITLFYTLIFLAARAQERNLYFVSAVPYNFEEYIDKGAMLYIYNDAVLDSIKPLTVEGDKKINFLHVYPEYSILVMLTEDYPNWESQHFSLIDISRPDSINSSDAYRIEYKFNNGTVESNLIIKDAIYYCLDVVGSGHYGLKRNLDIEQLNPQDFNHSYIADNPGGAINSKEFLLLYVPEDEKKLRISKGYNLREGPPFHLSPPDSIFSFKPGLYRVLANNNALFALEIDRSSPTEKMIGFSTILIYNKLNKSWFRQKIKGNYPQIRSFGTWLCGTVIDKNKGRYQEENGTLGKKYVFNRLHPGASERKEPTETFGEVFDDRAEHFGNYYPGILYALNIRTNSYLEWDTKQGDSEILLIEDNMVYYRVNDSIYRGTIVENALVETKLLIKDSRVPNIHWAFFSKS